MPSPLTAYLAGVASVSVALAVGFGGALVVANSVMTDKPKPPSKIERLAKHEQDPQAQTAINDTAFPAQASPILVVSDPPAQTGQTKTAATAEDIGPEGPKPPVVASRDSDRETNKKVEEERKQAAAPSRHSQKHERRADRKRQVAATRWDKKRKASAPVDVPSKAMIRQAPIDVAYEDDDDLMISSSGRLSFGEE